MLSCVPDSCLLSSKNCHACYELSGHVTACDGALGDRAVSLALAATDTEIVAAWLGAASNGGQMLLRLTRFAPDFTRLSEVDTDLVSSGGTVSLAAYSGGWAVAIDGRDIYTVEIHAFDAQGQYRGYVRRIDQAWAPLLASRPSGPPLLGYVGDYSLQQSVVTLLTDDLTNGTPPVVLGSGFPPRAIFIGDAFLVADAIAPSVRTARIELDGSRVAPMQDIGYGAVSEQLAVTTAGPMLAFFESNGEGLSYLVHLDGQGAPLSTAPISNSSEIERLLGVSADVLMITGPDLTIERLDPFGQQLWQATIASGGIRQQQLVQLGPDVVAGWVSAEGLGLAKIAP